MANNKRKSTAFSTFFIVFSIFSGCYSLPSHRENAHTPVEPKDASSRYLPSIGHAYLRMEVHSESEKHETVIINFELFFDEFEKKLTVIRDTSKDKEKFIYNKEDNEILRFQDEVSCEVKKLKDGYDSPLTLLSFLPGSESLHDESRFRNMDMFMLFVNETYVKTPNGDGEVWKSEQQLTIHNKQLECVIVHEFTSPLDHTPDCDTSYFTCKPQLKKIMMTCGQTFAVLEVVDLELGISDPEIFLQPPGVFCPEKTSQPLPELPTIVRFDVEETGGEEVARRKIWYDYEHKLLRMDFIEAVYGEESGRFMTIIEDVNNGVKYDINSFSGACTIEHSKDKAEIPSVEETVWDNRDQNSSEIHYVGKRKCRNIDCEVWVVRENEHYTHELYFTSDYVVNELLELQEGLVPAVVHKYVHNDNPKQLSEAFQRHIFDFETFYPFYSNAFDVSSCFMQDKKIPLHFAVTGPIDKLIKGAFPSFMELVSTELALTMKITNIIRLSELKLNVVDEKNAVLTASLLDIPHENVKDVSSETAINNLVKSFEKTDNSKVITHGVSTEAGLQDFVLKFNNAILKSKSPKGYTSGTLAGMIILGLILGSLLGVGVIYLIVKKTGVDQFFGRLITNQN